MRLLDQFGVLHCCWSPAALLVAALVAGLAAAGGVAYGVDAGEIGVAGEGIVGLAVDEEADLCDLGEVGVEGAEDGVEGECLDLDAGGVLVDEAATEVDDGELAVAA